MKKLLPHEQRRLREHAALTLTISPDTKTEITKKEVAEFTKDLLNTVARYRGVKHMMLALVETEKAEG
jgi:hypothetical protein